jgi:hypothetical protein
VEEKEGLPSVNPPQAGKLVVDPNWREADTTASSDRLGQGSSWLRRGRSSLTRDLRLHCRGQV